MTAHREGNVIDLGFTRLQVVDACSGIRYLFPIIILGLLLAWFFRAHWWKRLVLVFSTIPLIVFANGVRIALTGILYEPCGPKIAEGFLHDFAGWFTFMVALAVLLPEMWILKKIPFGRPPAEKNLPAMKEPGGQSPVWTKFMVAVLLLGLTLAVSQGVNFREEVPAKQSFSHFPLQLGEWRGQRETMEQRFIDTLDLSDKPAQRGVDSLARDLPAGQRLGFQKCRDGCVSGSRIWQRSHPGEPGADAENRF
jgi:exosortase/archaeosortase family protein